ncbi:uncharacterized protein DS421_19g672140 [Arachis hypogaea]|uniref:Uncharacterized protein n=1 Tax=Arachis hypogaea TaxID=3818 RepID=A0A6B9VGF1_ARAHY|nr:uncharacterized protein DS421_19g672140 [Arachis hypogaea]
MKKILPTHPDTQDAIPTKLKQTALFSLTAANLKDQSLWVPNSPFLLPKSATASCPIFSWTESAPCSWTTRYAAASTPGNLPNQQSECRSFPDTIVVLGGSFSAVFLSRTGSSPSSTWYQLPPPPSTEGCIDTTPSTLLR